jgi:transcriptional regulator with XRE-family HTH domain
MTVGQLIRTARERLGLTQKELAGRIRKEDGTPISSPYLNDIERDRRNPPAVPLLAQFAAELGLSAEYLYFLARAYPPDIARLEGTPEAVEAAWQAFRGALAGDA